MRCMDEKEVRKEVQFEYYKRMFGFCDKEPLVEVFAALLVKLNDNGVMFSFPDIQTGDCYVPIYDSNGGFRERLKLSKPDIPLYEEIKLDFLQHDIQVLQKMQKEIENFLKPVSLELSVDTIASSGELFMVLCGLCTFEQLEQNNWRRLHGLPMKRRAK
ncbi:hypothetical protein [Clostridium sp. E02]|uniref:hypothetical protein n=1 Tax=Clostridium sp. E02 TaxID=2487134 RepID=UPI000F52DEF4|nr:hypothetical protein [Clostridium sp. E02]